ncbi:MAG: aldehyde dehydrogenase family protein [Gammaproteobacteria bacterium]|nr:aldehyde dehydrogenase family protein [Gammaproteobacteria bacterium]NNJ83754.1 aldehyde dehydrogenase family protein [Gammaproteobacteria bacterium]
MTMIKQTMGELLSSALLLVDVQQNFFTRPGLVPPAIDLIACLSTLIERARTMDVPIIHVRTRIRPDGADRMPHWQRQGIMACVTGTPGYQPPDALAALPGERIFHKRFFSAFGCATLQPALEQAGITDLIVAGLYTHGCIRATILDAYERGFHVRVAEDAIGSTEPAHANITRNYLDGRAAFFLPSSEVLRTSSSCGSGLQIEGTRAHELRSPRNNRKPVGQIPFAEPASVTAACVRASAAGTAWRETDARTRANLLDRWADLLERDRNALIRLLAEEIGKPRIEALDELRRALAHIRVAAALCRNGIETTITDGVQVRYRALGTIGLLTPWNNPLAIPAGKLAPALAFGNSCVWKPAPHAPKCAEQLIRTLTEAGLPGGVALLIHGDSVTGKQLVLDEHIVAISVTGSVETGQRITALNGAANKRLQAELGGNNAAIILDDRHLDETALRALAMAVFGFSGQRCTAIRRLIVHVNCVERFTEAFARVVATLRIGDPMDPATEIGPLISREHRDRVIGRLNEALSCGARIVAETRLPTDLPGQCWLAPILLDKVDPQSLIAQQETFGPIGMILPAKGLDAAIDIANGVPQGLVAALYTADQKSRVRFMERIEAGILNTTGKSLAIHPEAPFSGWKASGVGPPEHGIWDRDFYARAQVVY